MSHFLRFVRVRARGLSILLALAFLVPATDVSAQLSSADQLTLGGMPRVADWIDYENQSNEMPAKIWGNCDVSKENRIGIRVDFVNGISSTAIYSGVANRWNSFFNPGINAESASGFFSTNCSGMHFLYNNNSTLPLAWENCTMAYSNNFDLDYAQYLGSHFRASVSGWGSARFQTYCGVLKNDFGDAPSPYATTQAQNGARHNAAGPMLGALRDTEADGLQSSDANADDLSPSGSDDEDGVRFVSNLVIGRPASIEVTASGGSGRLSAFIDWNRDGDWDEANEQYPNIAVNNGVNIFSPDVPANAVAGSTYARFRLTSAALSPASPTGVGVDGEVEDYRVEIVHDRMPDNIVFGSRNDVPFGSEQTSGSQLVTGISTAVDVSVVDGAYQIDGLGEFVTAPGTISQGQSIRVRHTASASPATSTVTYLTVGDFTASFASTTTAADRTPEGLLFPGRSDVARDSEQISDQVTISGINIPVDVSISNGDYNKNGAGWTRGPTTAVAGDTFIVRHISSTAFSTDVTTTLTVGTVSADFTSRTIDRDITPAEFVFFNVGDVQRNTTQTSNEIIVSGINAPSRISVVNGFYRINGGLPTSSQSHVVNGDRVTVEHVSSGAFSDTVTTTLTVGAVAPLAGISSSFSSTTLVEDADPDPFSFVSESNAPRNALRSSNVITVGGLNTTVPVSVTGHSSCAVSRSSASNGDGIQVSVTSAAGFSSAVSCSVSIGTRSATFTVTTFAEDTTPNAFAFTGLNNVARNSVQTSSPVTISGINSSAPVSVSNGMVSINGGPFVGSGTIQDGQPIVVRHTASSAFASTVTTTVTIGGVGGVFSSTTLAEDTVPNGFSFGNLSGVARSSWQTSNAITISGINSGAPVSVSNGLFSINGGSFIASGVIQDGQTLVVGHTSSSAFSATVTTTVTVGGVNASFSTTTLAEDITPNAFGFANVTNVPFSTVQTSAPVTITGLNSNAPVSATNGTVSINGGSFVSSGFVAEGGTVSVRHTSAAVGGTTVTSTVTIGGVSATFKSTTVATDTVPNAFSFRDEVAQPNTVMTSSFITISGINTPTQATVTGGEFKVDAGQWRTAPLAVTNGARIQVRHTSSLIPGQAVNTTLTVGGVSDTYTTTVLIDTSPDAIHFTDVTGVARNTIVMSDRVKVTGINVPVAVQVTGGEYRIGTGAWTTNPGLAQNNDLVQVRHTSALGANNNTNTTLTIGTTQTVSDTFTSKTR